MRPTIKILFAAIGLMAASVHAKPPTIVYPTGIFPTDVQNVQAAINQGGTVLLKATDPVGHPLAFNFGTPQHLPPLRAVIIQNDVLISGETIGASRTTVSGGSTPFRIFGGKNSIQGIKFDGALTHAILVSASNGTSIIGNQIKNVVPDLFVFPGVSLTLADGIDAFPDGGRPAADISGSLVISGNTFEDLSGSFSIAVQVDSVAANVTVSDNTFQLGQLASDLGLNNSGAIACIRCHSVVTISGNMITIGPGIVFDGIAMVGDADARYHVHDNTISSQGPITDGIDVFGQGGDPGPTVAAVIEHNNITVHNGTSGFNGLSLIGAVSQSTIQGNTLNGDAGVALDALALFPGDQIDQGVSNRFLFNDIANVTVSFSHVAFDTNTVNNIVRGQCVDVIDLGIGNDISCPNFHSKVNSSSFTTRQQMIQRALQAQSAVRAQSNGANRP